MDRLYEKLLQYAEEDICPCHMPGHKRREWGLLPGALYGIDITEIEGFDNLHRPDGILRELQREAAELYGAEESFYLVNGSTCGILSAVSAALPPGGHILMTRNCHRSAYHAVYLRKLSVSYLYPDCLEEYDICEAVTVRQVEAALAKAPDVGAVLIVSPTYEGRIADVRGIAAAVHRRGIPLIVDEAHGAHLGLAQGFHENSCQAGADLVIHSVHKTLPALTQTALLHVNGGLVDRLRLRRFLNIYQTSSPSYPLMASIDNALHYIKESSRECFSRFRRLYGEMRDILSECRSLCFLPEDPQRQDIGKFLIAIRQKYRKAFTGKQLYDMLLREYHIQAEMASGQYVLAMFTVNDGEETFRRMTAALLEIDRRLESTGDVLDGEERTCELYSPWQMKDIPLMKSPQAGDISYVEDSPRADRNLRAGDISYAEDSHQAEAGLRMGDISYAEGSHQAEAGLWMGDISYVEDSPQADRNLRAGNTSYVEDSPQAESNLRAGDTLYEEKSLWVESGMQGKCFPLAEAWDMEAETVELEESKGRYAAEFVNLYPPGIPLLAPGEQVTEVICRKLQRNVEEGLSVQGITVSGEYGASGRRIWIRVIKCSEIL